MSERHLIHDLLDEAATTVPTAIAVLGVDLELTYAELRTMSLRLAGWVGDLGLRRGDRILIEGRADHRLIGLLYASSRLGVIFAVIHPQVRGGALTHIIQDCDPKLVLADNPAWLVAAEQYGVRGLRLRALDQHGFWEATSPAPEPLPVDPAIMIYTSGTTGTPIAVVSTQQQVTFAVGSIQSVLAYESQDRVFLPLPLSFDYGLYQLFLAASTGAGVWLATESEAGPGLAAALRRSAASILPAMPSLASGLATLLDRRGVRLPDLRMLTSTGAVMPVSLLQRLRRVLPGVRIHVMYGLTECKRVSIMPADGDLVRPSSCGLPLPGTEVMVLDATGRRVAPGTIGEIIVRGPHVMRGYWQRPELTEERFARQSELLATLRTGDQGWVDEEGYLYFCGRADEIYKANGFRVSAAEVETAACRIPGVTSAAVLVPTPEHPEPALFVASSLPAAAVLAGLRAELEDVKIPVRCFVLPQLPLTGNYKVDKKALADAHR
jgi:acyl-CoA synthetase (AMP-forming)/AMP-acid ligase II